MTEKQVEYRERPKTRGQPVPELRILGRADHDEAFLTSLDEGGRSPAELFAGLAKALTGHGIEPISEKVYGGLDSRKRILEARREAYAAAGLDPDSPVTFVDGAAPCGPARAAVQIWGVRPGEGGSVRTVEGGRLWQQKGLRVLHLSAVHGDPNRTVSDQARGMFEEAAALAERNGFPFRRTVRTWIYLARLLDWYGEFNRVRTSCYSRHDFPLPASTGIQGKDGIHECFLDALLVDGWEVARIDATARQGSASAYGSSFSRGVELRRGEAVTVHVSGTASIDSGGNSVHLGDPSAQFLEMMLDVAAVLEGSGLGLVDIRQATLFCKDPATYEACRQAISLLSLPAFPTIAVRADVCRPELLVEMEAIAAR
ncbi:MAG: hypothetical protein Fur0037_11690 [Planctomycetota bacterium]